MISAYTISLSTMATYNNKGNEFCLGKCFYMTILAIAVNQCQYDLRSQPVVLRIIYVKTTDS